MLIKKKIYTDSLNKANIGSIVKAAIVIKICLEFYGIVNIYMKYVTMYNLLIYYYYCFLFDLKYK